MEDYGLKVYEKLSELTNVEVFQGRPEIINPLPAITFDINSDVPVYVVEGEISHQKVQVKLDIWTNSPSEARALLAQVEVEMRELGFLLSLSSIVPDPEEICHLTTQFIY